MRFLTILMTVALVATLALPATAQPWYARGSFYGSGWPAEATNQMYDDGTGGDAVAGDGIFSRLITEENGLGRHEWKVANDDWTRNFPPYNQFVHIETPGEQVLFTYDSNSYGDGWIPDSNIVWNDHFAPQGSTFEVIGSAPELGDWTTGVVATEAGGIYTVDVLIATPGSYLYKWRANGNWDDFVLGRNGAAGGFDDDIGFKTMSPNALVKFEFDRTVGRVRISGNAVPVEGSTWGKVKALYR
jgi:hypothetical protein